MYFENRLSKSILDEQEKKKFLLRMLKFNNQMLEIYSKKKGTQNMKINWHVLDKARNIYLLLTEKKQGSVKSYMEKQFSVMLRNLNKEELIKMIEFNIKHYDEELKVTEARILAEKLLKDKDGTGKTNSNKDEYSPSKYTSEASESDTYSCGMSNDHISLNESGSGSSKAMSRRTLHRHTLTQPEVGTLDSSGNISASLNPLKHSDSKKKGKSKFGMPGEAGSSKRLFSQPLDLGYSSKKLSKGDHEIGVYGFLKGGNTRPLVSELLSCCIRNDNVIEVYERLKFFARE